MDENERLKPVKNSTQMWKQINKRYCGVADKPPSKYSSKSRYADRDEPELSVAERDRILTDLILGSVSQSKTNKGDAMHPTNSKGEDGKDL